jgi:hypothetical protein
MKAHTKRKSHRHIIWALILYRVFSLKITKGTKPDIIWRWEVLRTFLPFSSISFPIRPERSTFQSLSTHSHESLGSCNVDGFRESTPRASDLRGLIQGGKMIYQNGFRRITDTTNFIDKCTYTYIYTWIYIYIFIWYQSGGSLSCPVHGNDHCNSYVYIYEYIYICIHSHI